MNRKKLKFKKRSEIVKCILFLVLIGFNFYLINHLTKGSKHEPIYNNITIK